MTHPAPTKGLSLWQPYASLIAIGAILPAPVKPYETRDYPPPPRLIGQRLAIHAAKYVDLDYLEWTWETLRRRPDIREALINAATGMPSSLLSPRYSEDSGIPMPVGCVVATATVAAAYQCGADFMFGGIHRANVMERRANERSPDHLSIAIDEFGNYAPGRWAWLLTEVEMLTPTKITKGNRKVFTLPADWQG